MPNNKINLNKNIIKELIDSTSKSTPGIKEWKINSIELKQENSEVIEISMVVNVDPELNQKSNVIDEFEDFLKDKLKSILDINKEDIILTIGWN